ncbi:hypothetical protein [Microbacterium mcarthurae (nom. nud.)]|uniref:Uncharacterized protein n=1 Tax=Microbacterium mcarthurae TaxID=3035918 RepID=A0ABW9GEW4_9MICO
MSERSQAAEERFRAAVRQLNTGSYADSVALGSLLASVQGDAAYELAAREELAPRAGELDLHLNGESIVNHTANAAAFGVFVKRIADGVKVIARDALGLRSMHSDLMVEPGPGSVRVLFKTPDPVLPGSLDHDDTAGVWSDPNRQSMALLRVSQMLALADPDSEGESTMDALVSSIPAAARVPLLEAVTSVTQQDWSLTGEFRQRGLGIQPIALSSGGARRLRSALGVRERETRPLTLTGRFDGHRRARSVCWFIDEVTGRTITAVVPTPDLMHAVAELSRDDNQRVRAIFSVTTSIGAGGRETGRKSYLLEDVTELSPSSTPLI